MHVKKEKKKEKKKGVCVCVCVGGGGGGGGCRGGERNGIFLCRDFIGFTFGMSEA